MKKIKYNKTIRRWWLPYLWEDLDMMDKIIKSCCEEWAEDDTHIDNKLFDYGFSENEVYGDSYYRPGIQEKVDMLCSLIESKNGDSTPKR